MSPGLIVCVCDSPYVTENNKECTSEIHDFLVGSQDLGTFVNILSYKDPGVISFETELHVVLTIRFSYTILLYLI